MLMADETTQFETCPRCGIGAFERLRTHSYCIECNFIDEKPSGSIESVLVELNKYVELIPSDPAQIIPITKPTEETQVTEVVA